MNQTQLCSAFAALTFQLTARPQPLLNEMYAFFTDSPILMLPLSRSVTAASMPMCNFEYCRRLTMRYSIYSHASSPPDACYRRQCHY